MTAIRGYVAPTDETGALGVHSLDQFVLAVPDANAAQEFYGNFGLDIARDGNTLAIKTFGHEHRWGSVVEGKTKALHHLSFGCYAEDLPRLKTRIEGSGVALIDPPPGFESNGFWFRNHENVLIQVKVAPKVSPDRKSESKWAPAPAGVPGAAIREKSPVTRPRRLSHVLTFTADVDASIKFYERTLGLRLSDRASDLVAFMHGIHGSDHHMLALAKSSAPGFHHCSWDVGSIDEIGLGAMRMHDKGYTKGWGLGATCSARIISIMCATPGAASRNMPAISIISPRSNAGRRPTTSRRIRSISGAPTCRRNSRSITRRARADRRATRKHLNRHGRACPGHPRLASVSAFGQQRTTADFRPRRFGRSRPEAGIERPAIHWRRSNGQRPVLRWTRQQ